MKYTEEQLLSYQPNASLPQGADLSGFVAMVEKVKQAVGVLFDDERRGSLGKKKYVKKEAPKMDEDGWVTFAKPRKSVGADDAEQKEQRSAFRETFVKAKPNNKNLSSSKPADAKDAIADKTTLNFNAFHALEADEDDE